MSGLMIRTVCVLALLATSAQHANAQRPDFSGSWSRPAETAGGRGAPDGDMGSGWGRALTITQGPALLTVQYDPYVRGDLQPPLRFHYALDGSPSRNTVMVGRGIQQRTTTAAWSGDTLVLNTVFEGDEPDLPDVARIEVRRRLWLDGPSTLVVEAARSGVLGGSASTTRAIYRR